MGKIILEMPDIGNYNLDNVGEMALYNAHFDFYSIRGLIDTTNKSINDISEMFRMEYVIAEDFGDIYRSSKALDNQCLHNSRVVPLAYTSILLMMVSSLEEAFNCLCRTYHIKNKYSIEYTDLYGQGLERAITYLDKVVGIKGIKQERNWSFIVKVRDIRNAVVHNGGRVKKDKVNKYIESGFYIREEDNQVMFDYEMIVKIYDEIMEFIDNVFRKTPQ
ncbi:hypothetical protein Q3258_16865 [Clostridioides difficile]